MKKFVLAIVALWVSAAAALAFPTGSPLDRKLYLEEQNLYQIASHGIALVSTLNKRTQLNLTFIGADESPFLNLHRQAAVWVWCNNLAHPSPAELDSNGWPLPGAIGFSNTGYCAYLINGVPSQFLRPTNYYQSFSGHGKAAITDTTTSTNTNVACSGTKTGQNTCDNQACTNPTGQFAGQTLTITVSGSCQLFVGQPITNGSTVVNKFGVPTIIVGMSGSANCPSCTGTGAAAANTGTYLVNWSQTVASGPLISGFYNEISITNEVTANKATYSSTITATDATNPLKDGAVVAKIDLLKYAFGQVIGETLRQRVTQGGYGVIRDLNVAVTNLSSVATWGDRKPPSYYSYSAPEMRSSLYAGTATYGLNAGSNDFSVNLGASLPADKQHVCAQAPLPIAVSSAVNDPVNTVLNMSPGSIQVGMRVLFVTASGGTWNTGATVGVAVSFPVTAVGVSSITITMDSSGLGTLSSATVATTPTSGTITFSIDGGTTKYPVMDYRFQGNLSASGASASWPYSRAVEGYTFNATMQMWSAVGSGVGGSCLNNAISPEAFVQMNQEMGTSPWIVMPLYASDPVTDYPIQYSLLLNQFSWSIPPRFEIPDETWNCSGHGVGAFGSALTRVYIANDATWNANKTSHIFCGSGGDINNWSGKAGSLLAQAVRAVSQDYLIIVGVQTTWPGSNGIFNPSGAVTFYPNVQATSYIGQALAVQSGCAGVGAIQTSCPAPFQKTTFYQAAASTNPASGGAITIANYMAIGGLESSTVLTNEIALAWCYYYQAAGCASHLSLMTSFFALNNVTAALSTRPSMAALWSGWYTYLAHNCGGGGSCVPMRIVNYEGNYTTGTLATDSTQTITGAVNDPASTVLTITANGCVVGMTNGFTFTGGTWATANGSYLVTAASTNSCTIALNSSGLGTFASGTMTYSTSSKYVSNFRINSWVAPDLATLTTTQYNTIATTSGACAPVACSDFPSQFNFAGTPWGDQSNCCWLQWGTDIWGYFPQATSTTSTASAGLMTLGGTINGVFKAGQTLLGGGISGATITGACSQTGALPAGANAGDQCPISVATTVTSNAINGTIAPQPATTGGSIVDPIPSFVATCDFNGVASGACR